MSNLAETNLLLKQYQPLVVSLARKCASKLPSSVELDDLIQVGMIGLYQSLERFDASVGVRFDLFASQRISGAIIDELRSNDFFSRSLRKDQKNFANTIRLLEHEFGRKPKDSEVAERLAMKLCDYQKTTALANDAQILYYEDFGDEDGVDFLDRSLGDIIIDPLNILEVNRTRTAVAMLIMELPERDQQVMSMYYENDMTLKEVSIVFGLTEARVSQIISKIVSTLRFKLKDFG